MFTRILAVLGAGMLLCAFAMPSVAILSDAEMRHVSGGGIPDCDCGNTGFKCMDASAAVCTNSVLGDACSACEDSAIDEVCNIADPWDAADCVVDPGHTCKYRLQGTCTLTWTLAKTCQGGTYSADGNKCNYAGQCHN